MQSPLRLAAVAALAALPARAEVPRVVADTPVVHSLVAMVMGDLGAPELLLDRGADAHDFQLRPSQLRALKAADLVVWIGPEMTPWLVHALESGRGRQDLALLHVPATLLIGYGEAPAGSAGGHDHDEDSGTGDPPASPHDHGGTDPHAWLDPANAALWVGTIAGILAELDPDNAGAYLANAEAAQGRIAALDTALRGRLAPAEGKGLLFGHAAYGYFAAHYGLAVAGSLAEGDAADPGAAHVAALRSRASAGEIACAFPEAGQDPRPIESLVAGTPARLGAPLDPEGRSAEPGPGLYLAVLDGIGTAIADCLAGD